MLKGLLCREDSQTGELTWFKGSWEEAGATAWGISPNYQQPTHFYVNVPNAYPRGVPLTNNLINAYDCSQDTHRCDPVSEKTVIMSCPDHGDNITLRIRESGVTVYRNDKLHFHQPLVDNWINYFNDGLNYQNYWLLGEQCLGRILSP